MAIDGIGGVGALNVSSNVKSVKPAEPTVQVSTNAGTAGTQIQVSDLPPVTPKGSNDGNPQQSGYRDDAAVQSDKEISPDKVRSAVDDLNKQVKQASPLHKTRLSFQYHDETNRISITVTDSDTDEVIREIPPEKALDMLAKAWEMAGLLVDEKR